MTYYHDSKDDEEDCAECNPCGHACLESDAPMTRAECPECRDEDSKARGILYALVAVVVTGSVLLAYALAH